MGLVNLWQPSRDLWRVFWFNNWIDHQDIVQAIASQLSIENTLYVIDPWLDQDASGILERHQQYHNDMNAALNLTGEDLSRPDFESDQGLQSWGWQHYQEHLAARQVLSL